MPNQAAAGCAPHGCTATAGSLDRRRSRGCRPVRGSRATRARLKLRFAEPAQSLCHRTFRQALQVRHKRRSHFPIGWMISAEPVAELLPQEFLRIPSTRVCRARIRTNANPRPFRRGFLRLRDEPFLAHARQDDVTALDGAIKVGPRRERGRRARQSGDESALG